MLGFSIFTATWLCVASVLAAGPTNNSSPTKSPTPESFQIRNKKYGELLRPENANGANGTRIVLYPGQPWKCMTWKLLPAGEATFQLQNHFTSKTFSARTEPDKSQPPVTQVPFAAEPKERPTWQLNKLPDGTCKITEPKTGRALTAVKDGNDSSLKIVVAPWEDKDEQKWELLKTDPKQLTM